MCLSVILFEKGLMEALGDLEIRGWSFHSDAILLFSSDGRVCLHHGSHGDSERSAWLNLAERTAGMG